MTEDPPAARPRPRIARRRRFIARGSLLRGELNEAGRGRGPRRPKASGRLGSPAPLTPSGDVGGPGPGHRGPAVIGAPSASSRPGVVASRLVLPWYVRPRTGGQEIPDDPAG